MPESITTQNMPFILDDRQIGRLLDELKTYCQQIPFAENRTWAEVIFSSGASWPTLKSDLVRLFSQPELASGELTETQAFILAFLKLLETPRTLLNQLPTRYQDLYYRDLLGLTELPAQPDRIALSFGLSDSAHELVLPAGTLFDAGQDNHSTPLQYRLEEALVSNHAQWTDLRWCRPSTENALTWTKRIVFDASADQKWPADGVRLFDPSPTQEKNAKAGQDQAVVVGRIIRSPVLAVAGDTRCWIVKFATPLSADPIDASTLQAELGNGEQWSRLIVTVIDTSTYELKLDPNECIAPLNLAETTPPNALLRITRTDCQSVPRVANIKLNVIDATAVQIATQDGLAVNHQSFYPFGGSPQIGSGINLALRDWWLLGHCLTKVTVTPAWQDLPTCPWRDWYKNYPEQARGLDKLTVTPYIVKADGARMALNQGYPPEQGIQLFCDKDNQGIASGQALQIPVAIPCALDLARLDQNHSTRWPWCLRLELNTAFFHAEYAQHLTIAPNFKEVPVVDDNGREIKYPNTDRVIKEIKVDVPEVWNPPYTPYWKSLQIDYTAEDNVVSEQKVYTPFGYISPTADVSEPCHSAESRAELYLGITGIQPNQLLSLYWHLRSPQPQKICWEYLAQGEQWRAANEYISDGTAGLHKSGIWLMNWPTDALDQASSLPAGRYWLRAKIGVPARTVQSDQQMPVFPKLLGIQTNAGWATLIQPEAVDAAHFIQPLPAGSVTRALETLEGLQEVKQPWPAEGGNTAESKLAFSQRVARRLRHRARALNGWDLVTLLKDHYPGIFEMRLADAEAPRSYQARPIRKLVMMPSLEIMDNTDGRQPKLSPMHLNEMRDWLKGRASSWLELECCNPEYVPVPIELAVKFKSGISQAYGLRQLWQALEQQYLPWISGRTEAQVIGKRLDYYELRSFIKKRSEVETVDVKLNGRAESCLADSTQVLVLVQSKPEYAKLGMTFVDEKQSQYRQAAIYGNGLNQVGLTVRYPSCMQIASKEINVTADQIFLYDCDTGERLYCQPDPNQQYTPQKVYLNGKQLGYTQQCNDFCKALEYSEALSATHEADVSQNTYYVYAGEVTGTYRIGLGIELQEQGEKISLRSHEAGKYLTLVVYPKIDDSQAVWDSGAGSLDKLPMEWDMALPDLASGVKVRLTKYNIHLKSVTRLPEKIAYDVPLGEFKVDKKICKFEMLEAEPVHAFFSQNNLIRLILINPDPETEHGLAKGKARATFKPDPPGGDILSIYEISIDGLALGDIGSYTSEIPIAVVDDHGNYGTLKLPTSCWAGLEHDRGQCESNPINDN